MDNDKDETYFDELINEIKPPKCPKCGSDDVMTNQFHAICLTNCGWVGDLSNIAADCSILKSIFVCESFFNLINTGPNSIKETAFSIARQKGLPGSDSERTISVSRAFLNQLDDFGEEINSASYYSDRFIKLLKLNSLTTLNRLCHLFVKIGEESLTVNRTIQSIIGRVNPSNENKSPLDGKNQEDSFLRKTAVNISKKKTELDDHIVSIIHSVYGRPDIFFEREFTNTGAYTDKSKPCINILNTSNIWQPFYWPAIDFSTSNLLRLAAVMQIGQDNLTYIVNECMDTGNFSAGVYKRNIYSKDVKFVKSKADTAEEAIRRIRTSFEKTILDAENNNVCVDLSWIKDWGYEYALDKSVHELVSAPFWRQSLSIEMLNLIGYEKNTLLEEMYQEMTQNQMK
jgi:hypothetical protein